MARKSTWKKTRNKDRWTRGSYVLWQRDAATYDLRPLPGSDDKDRMYLGRAAKDVSGAEDVFPHIEITAESLKEAKRIADEVIEGAEWWAWYHKVEEWAGNADVEINYYGDTLRIDHVWESAWENARDTFPNVPLRESDKHLQTAALTLSGLDMALDENGYDLEELMKAHPLPEKEPEE